MDGWMKDERTDKKEREKEKKDEGEGGIEGFRARKGVGAGSH